MGDNLRKNSRKKEKFGGVDISLFLHMKETNPTFNTYPSVKSRFVAQLNHAEV